MPWMPSKEYKSDAVLSTEGGVIKTQHINALIGDYKYLAIPCYV